MLKNDQVVVFSRDVLQPWDDIPRFDFLDCNLRTIVKEGMPHVKKTATKDSFIGNINQLKTTQAKKKEKPMNSFDKQLQEHTEKYRSLIMSVPNKKKDKVKLKP